MRLTCLNFLLFVCLHVCLGAGSRDRDRDNENNKNEYKYNIASKNNVQKINNKLNGMQSGNPIYIVKQSLTRVYSAI